MNFLYPSLGTLAVLGVFVYLVGSQNRDLLRVRAYREFVWRLLPLLSVGVLIIGMPFVMGQTTPFNDEVALLVYLGGAAVLALALARSVAPDERRATAAFRKGDYASAATLYEELAERRPLPRYYASLGASRDADGNFRGAIEALDQAIKLDPRLGIAYYNRASVLAALGETPRARSDLQMVFRTDSGRALRRATEKALESLDKV